MANFKTFLALSGGPSLTRGISATSGLMASHYQLRHLWWLRAVTLVMAGYIIASETLKNLPDFSRWGIALALLLFFLLALGRLLGISSVNLGSWVWIPCAFVVYCALRSFDASQFGNPLEALSATTSAYLGGIGVALALQAGVRFRSLVYAQIVAGLCEIVAGFYGIGNEAPPGNAEVRYAGLTGNANDLGLHLTLAACLIWLLPKKSGRFACSFAFVLAAYGVMMTGSRQALMAGFFFLVLVVIQTWAVIKRHRFGFSVVAGGLCFISVLMSPNLIERGRNITAVQRALDYETDSSYLARVNMIQQGFRFWRQAPLLGNGLDAFQELSGRGGYAHNDYVELLCDLGLLGAVLFYAIHASILLQATRLPGSLKFYCWL